MTKLSSPVVNVVGEQAVRHLESTGTLSTDVLMGAFVCRDPSR
jgi:hypothetical protein